MIDVIRQFSEQQTMPLGITVWDLAVPPLAIQRLGDS